MTSFVMKVIVSPIVVLVAAWLFPNVEYANWSQAIAVGLAIALVGIVMEYLLLTKNTLWISTISDYVASVIVIYFVSNLFAGGQVTIEGALLTGVIIAVIEHFTHLYLIRSGKTQKSPA